MKNLDTALDYDDQTSAAVYAVLLELGQVLGAYKNKFVVIGGSVPWLLCTNADPRHLGTMDIDLSLDADALGDGEYAQMIELLEQAGYQHNEKEMRFFQMRRTLAIDNGAPISILIDLLMPREAKVEKNKPPLLANFAVQRADGAGIAMHNFVDVQINGKMPDGRPNSLSLRVASIPALLVMKGYALTGRDKKKDAYDIYFSIKNFAGGAEALATQSLPLLNDAISRKGFENIASKFKNEKDFGPVTVKIFLADSGFLGDMTTDQVQTDAYRRVRAWLDALGL
jgi:hypothetical protein